MTFTPTGVRTPVVIMSIRVLTGNSQALAKEGIWTARSISSISSSQVMRRSSGQSHRNGALNAFGTHPEYHRSAFLERHSFSGFNTTVVSTMLRGAGSVEVSALPTFPKTLSTSGNSLSSLSWIWRYLVASVTEIPGRVIGMYRIVPSLRGGMNSSPRPRKTGTVRAITRRATRMVAYRCLRTKSSAGW